RVEVGAGSRARCRVTEKPSFPADDERPDRVLAAVVVKRHFRPLEEDDKLVPLSERVVHRLAEQALRQYSLGRIRQPCTKLSNDRSALGLANLRDGVGSGFTLAQLTLDAIEPADVVQRYPSSALASVVRLSGLLELAAGVSPTSGVHEAVFGRCRAIGFIAVRQQHSLEVGQQPLRHLAAARRIV